MNLAQLSTTQILIYRYRVCRVVAVGIGIWLSVRKRRTLRLRNQFGDAEYTRAVEEGGCRQKAESVLDQRTDRVERLHIQPLAPGDRARFVESWGRIQARFVDGPGSAITDADGLVGDVMSTRGYPVADFEQRAADISVDYPLVLDNYRAAHRCALRQTNGQATQKTCVRP